MNLTITVLPGLALLPPDYHNRATLVRITAEHSACTCQLQVLPLCSARSALTLTADCRSSAIQQT